MTHVTAEVYRRVCDILFDEWDPIGVNAFAPRDEYDSYAAGLIGRIMTGSDEVAISMQLADIIRICMDPAWVDEVRDQRVARNLIAAVQGEQP